MNGIKRTTAMLIIFTVLLAFIPVSGAATTTNSPSLDGLQIFPKDNIWNTRVDNLPVDAKSAVYITDLETDTAPYTGLHHYIRNAIPFNVVNASQSHQYISSFSYPAYSDNVPFPIPANPLFEQGCADHHMEIIDEDEMALYELSAARQNADGSWSGAIGAVWDLTSNKFRKNNVTPMWSANEAGLPIFSGLVRYDEVSSGSISHALRISVPKLQNTYIWPARSSSDLKGVTDPTHSPAGQRLRLKDSYDISGYPPQAKVILQALKTYGAMAATNNGMGLPMSVTGSPDTRWDFTDLNTLWNVPVSEFEAVDVSSLMIDRNSGQATQLSGIPPTSLTVTSPNGGEILQSGLPQTVTWSYTGSPGPFVKIVLFKAGTEADTIASSVQIGSAGTGSYTGPIYPSGTTGSDYTVRIESLSQPTITDTSDNSFTLTSDTITVTEPHGGESWQRGTSHTVTWDYSGSSGLYVKILLVKGDVEVGTISASTSIGSGGKGAYTWEIYPSGSTGSDYRVRVQSISQPTITNTSRNTFTMTSAPVAPVAAFTGTPLFGPVPLDVTFTDASTGVITGYAWDFGDSETSTEKNPSHQYTTAGTYSVNLTVTGPGGSNSSAQTGYITVSEAPPVAGFSGAPVSGTVPLDVTFTDASTGVITGYSWDFGDSETSTEKNPSHQYTTAGTYSVNLTVTGPGGSNSSAQTGYITVSEAPPVAGFSGAPVSGTVPLDVTFTDASTGVITGYSWDFGDSETSTEKNPSHQYTTAGTYSVNLTVTGPGGSNSSRQTGYITVSEAPPVAGFSGAPVSGVVPLTVTFTDASTGVITGYTWDFGDSVTSTGKNPSHQYSKAGTYSVNLTVTGPGGSNSSAQTGYITVSEAPPVAGFSGAPVSGIVPLTVTFTDASTGVITGYTWEFGDSETSTEKNPSHQYSKAGTYSVNLTVTGPGGSNSSRQTGYITVSEAPPIAGFSGIPVSGVVPLTVTFTDASTGVITGYAWDFGDSVTSTEKNPSHQYTAAGTYSVNLTVTGPGGSNSSRQTGYITVSEAPPVAGFSGAPVPGIVPSTVTFTDASTGVIIGYSWDFGDSETSTEKNPSHQYSKAGTYSVNLTVTGPGGSNSSRQARYITVSEAPPIAGFSGTPVSGTVPLDITFTDASKGVITGCTWDFGDSETSTEKNPSHTYMTAGTYSVNLTVNGPGGSNSSRQARYITVSEAPPIAGFSGAPVSGIVPSTVTFTDASTGVITGYAWDFGDSETSTEKNPFHQYTAAGTYSVNLTVTGPGGSNSSRQTGYITISEAPPVAGFSGAPVSGIVPLTVTFTDASSGVITGYTWDFGDSVTSTGKNPSHQYSKAGTYSVNLTVTGPGGSSSSTQTGYITVSEPLTAITVTSPNGGEMLQRGTSHTVTWDYSGSPGSTVKIMLTKAGVEVGTISSGTSIGTGGKGSYSWPIYSSGSTGSDYKVSIQSINQPTVKDTSNNNFTLTPAGTISPSITVTAPNGGESWQRGTSHTVTWDYNGSPGSTVKIMLVKGTTEVGTIIASTSIGTGGKGSYSWLINPSGSTGGDYKVSVQSISQPSVKDTSNSFFTLAQAGITTPVPTPTSLSTSTITVTSPNGTESWKRGTSHTVTWDYSGSPGSTVKIMLVKGTTEVGTIIASTSIGTGGKGSYSWLINPSGSTGGDYKVSVQSISQPSIKDMSNSFFTLAPAGITTPVPTPTPLSTSTITVTSPKGTESWKRGTSHTVTWDYTGNPGSTVKIMLVKGTTEVGTIIASTSIGTGGKGSYSWPINPSGSTGGDYKVSVQSKTQPSVKDTSNSFFTLTL